MNVASTAASQHVYLAPSVALTVLYCVIMHGNVLYEIICNCSMNEFVRHCLGTSPEDF